MTPTVHVLHYGRALCGNVHGVPSGWGEAHRWVGLDHIWRGGWRRAATCAECKFAAERLEEMRQPETS